MKKDLSDQMAKTYRALRLGLAVLAFTLPLLLPIGGYLKAGAGLAGSLSAYYHAGGEGFGQGVMRNEFVGVLFAVSVLLFAYQGYSKLEDYALNLAGVLAVGVALFPTALDKESGGGLFSLHGTFAVLFFFCIGYVCIWRAGDTLPLIADEALRNRYRRTYKILGWAMGLLPLAAWAFTSLSPLRTSAIYFIELAGIYVFAAYWVVKSREASKTRVDEKATRGEIYVEAHKLSDVMSPLPVARAK